MKEINDSVYFINGEGLFIKIDSGYYDAEGVQSLILKNPPGSRGEYLRRALSVLRTYEHVLGHPGDILIPLHNQDAGHTVAG